MFVHFSQTLFVNITLTNLDLEWNGIGVFGAVSLSQAHSVGTLLTHLDLMGKLVILVILVTPRIFH